MKSTAATRLMGVLLLVAAPSFAEYDPPNGTENYYDLLSPSFYGGGASVVSLENPQANAINPAASGAVQVPTVDLNYQTLADLSGVQGWGGHFVNVGATNPTRSGVFTWSNHFLYSTMPSADFGFMWAADFSFSKHLYENLLLGVGLGASIGTNDAFDWSLGADMGLLHFVDSDRLNNVRWGVALRDFGKGFGGGVSGKTTYPTPFSLVGGIGFTAIDSRAVDLDVTADLTVLQFQNIRLGLGVGLELFDAVGIQVTTSYDLRELIDETIEMGSFIPSFGVSLELTTGFTNESDFLGLAKKGFGTSDVKTQVAAGPLAGTVWGFGAGVNARLGQSDTTPPLVVVVYPETTWISVNGDGVQDGMDFELRISDERFVYGYEFRVQDAAGSSVKHIESGYSGPASTGWRGLIDRLSYVTSSIEVPETMSWDGRDDNGARVPDGSYTFSVRAWDDNRNERWSDAYQVLVDSTPPTASVAEMTELARIFSPNNDGNKDTVEISQTGSVEDLWFGEIVFGDTIVRSYTWENSEPKSFDWDGVTDDGTLAEDGVYEYRVYATDRGGNSGEWGMDGIVLNTQTTPISLSIDRSHFSPNGDGIYDTVELSIDVPIKTGVRSWSVAVHDESGQAVTEFEGQAVAPERILYDGMDRSGRVLAEGTYRAAITVIYINGNNPSNESPPFTVDVTPPDATITPDLALFSPNGDGSKDIITFFQETSVEERWIGEIYNGNGLAIHQYTWHETADSKVSWDGHARGGLIAPDGQYSFKVFSQDRAGNLGGSREVYFELNTEATTVFLSTEFDAISPNSDGVRDHQNFLLELSSTEGIDSFSLRVYSDTEELVRSFSGRKAPDRSYAWEGLADDGSRVSDGVYYGQLEIRYESGNEPTVSSRPFVVDTSFPVITTVPDKELFSPNGDGNKDTVTFKNDSSREDLWEADIVDESGTVARKVFWKDTVPSFVWDGSDDAGNRAPDGVYYSQVSTTDDAGNSAVARSAGVRLDTRITSIFVTASPDRISPNGDGILEAVAFSTLVKERGGVSAWRLTVQKSDGTVVREFEGSRIPESIVWNGRDSEGQVVSGDYFASFSVDYDMGNKPVARSNGVAIDVSPPEIDIRFDPRPFSPDGDEFEDRLEILIDANDEGPIAKWGLTILDPRGRVFKRFSKVGEPPRKFYWYGFSDEFELVQAAEDYPYELYVEDDPGNLAKVQGTIPIDVLVVRDGDRMKIRISNIAFEPNSPDLETDDVDVMEKNSWVLGRIADIFRKYADYSIRIEGHAVSVYWDDEALAVREQNEELVPLSRARAQTVMDELVKLGIDPERVQVEGIGGAQPIVPHGDQGNRWKNRRIEFILLK
jgi:flagellar hook assembly protein FlgD/outer membrane protein OmpA-like peptidoglycan-associated protein